MHDSVGPRRADPQGAAGVGPALRPVATASVAPSARRIGWMRFGAAAAVGLGVFVGWAIFGPLLAARLPGRERVVFARRGIQRMFAWMLRALTRLGVITVDNRALDAVAGETPLIIVPNHPSMLDAVVVISRLPAACCVMKRALLRNPLTGTSARLAGYVDNGSVAGLVRKSVTALNGGGQLLIFPEGTRSEQRPVGRFTRAYALIAQRSGVPMQTVLIETDSPYATKGWPLLRPPPLPIRCTVRLGRRFEPSDDIDGQVAQMQAYFESELGAAGSRLER